LCLWAPFLCRCVYGVPVCRLLSCSIVLMLCSWASNRFYNQKKMSSESSSNDRFLWYINLISQHRVIASKFCVWLTSYLVLVSRKRVGGEYVTSFAEVCNISPPRCLLIAAPLNLAIDVMRDKRSESLLTCWLVEEIRKKGWCYEGDELYVWCCWVRWKSRDGAGEQDFAYNKKSSAEFISLTKWTRFNPSVDAFRALLIL
jgi:hypothetical protein